MDASAFLEASPLIQVHALSALAALVLGTVLLVARKGTLDHRRWGWVWVALMAAAAVTSAFIYQLRLIGPFSPIHALSIWTLIALVIAIRAIRSGNVRRHAGMMRGLYYGGLVVAGLFTLLPGRVFNRVLFGGDSWAGFLAVSAAVVLLIVLLRLRRPRRLA